MTTDTTAAAWGAITASNMLPPSWTMAKDILNSDAHEGHRLLLHLLDQVHGTKLLLSELGVNDGSTDEEVTFVAKLESIALFAILAERYGQTFGLDQQRVAFTSNADLFDVARDLGIQVNRSDLPWALDVVGLDRQMRDSFELPPDQLPLDILFVVASRCRDWYEETIGTSMSYQGRHRCLQGIEVAEFMKHTLADSYGTLLEELEAGSEIDLARDVVRVKLGNRG